MNTPLPPFDPPYDSPIQDRLAWVISKYVAPGTRFIKEKKVETAVGGFRVDLVLELSEKKSIGIECDGEDFHDPLYDLFRDALILGSSCIVAMYRFPGRVLSSRPEDALYLLSVWAPEFFNDRIAVQRDLLASEEMKSAYERGAWKDSYPYIFEWDYRVERNFPSPVEAVRHCFGLQKPPPDSIDRIWEFSQNGTYRTVEALAEAYAAQYPTREWRGWTYYVQHKSQLFDTLDAKHFK